MCITKNEIEDRTAACGKPALKKLHVQQGKFSEVEDIVMKFIVQCRSSSIPVSGPILMEKAREIALKLNVKDAWMRVFQLDCFISSKCDMEFHAK